MSFLERLGIVKAAPVRDLKDEPSQGYGITHNRKSAVTYKQVVTAAEALKHPVLFRILNKIAESVQTVGWYAEAVPGQPAPKQGDLKKINELLASPNDSMSPEQLRYWMALSFAVYRRVPYKVGKGVGNMPNAVYPLNAGLVTANLDDRGMIVSYEYGTGAKKDKFPSLRKAPKGNSFVHEIFAPSLSGSLGTQEDMSPLATLGMPAEITRLLLQRAHDTASGHPNIRYIIAAEKTLTGPQKQAVIDHIENSGPGDDTSGYTLFLYNTKIEVHNLDNKLSDIHTKIPYDDMVRQMAGTYGVPIALVGLGGADAAKFAGNYMESRISFWEDTIIPGYLVPIEGGLTHSLCAPDSNIRVRFDRDSIPALNDARVKTAVQLSQVTFLTQNEKREMVGYEASKEVIEDKPNPVSKPANNG